MEYEDIDALRLQAFKTNSDEDRKAYFDATSKWFQDEIYRMMERGRELTQLRAENEKLREALVRAEEEIKIADFSVEGMAEIKAIIDGESTNTVSDVVDWVLSRIAKEALK